MVHLRLAVKFGMGVELEPMFFVVTLYKSVFERFEKNSVVYFSFHFKFLVLSNFFNYIVRRGV
jgi:hypothetical protein